MSDIVGLFLTFAGLSLLAVGGGDSILAQVERDVVDRHHWITQAAFVHLYTLGKLAPGPSTMYVAGVGFFVDGIGGAIAAGIGFVLPTSILVFVAESFWQQWRGTQWKSAIQLGLAPVTSGLIVAGVFALVSAQVSQVQGWKLVELAVLSIYIAVVALRTRINPAFLILGGGAVGSLVMFV
ncbi:MAG: chromate transporter [Actinomycetes bacterium]